jgi:hypothetical protein
MKIDWGNLLGIGATVGGGVLGATGAADARGDMTTLMNLFQRTLPGATVTGPGGATGSVLPGGAGGSSSLGDMEQLRQLLIQSGGANLSQANQDSILSSIFQPAIRQQFDTANQALSGAYTNGFQRPLQNTAFAGAARQLEAAGGDFSGIRDQTLNTLRSQAQPFEARAYDTLQQDLFGSGRMGTSGGGIQTEAFARGLGQADLQRQLMANDEARAQQTQALNVGTGMAGVGTGVASLEDQLLQSAFGRFGSTMQLGQDLTNQQFNLGNSAVTSGINLGRYGMDQMGAAAGMAQAGANTQLASDSNVAAVAGARAEMPTGKDMLGNILTDVGGKLLGGAAGSAAGGVSGILGNLFGGGSAAAGAAGATGALAGSGLAGITPVLGATTTALPASLGGAAAGTAAAGGAAAAGTGATTVGSAGASSMLTTALPLAAIGFAGYKAPAQAAGKYDPATGQLSFAVQPNGPAGRIMKAYGVTDQELWARLEPMISAAGGGNASKAALKAMVPKPEGYTKAITRSLFDKNVPKNLTKEQAIQWALYDLVSADHGLATGKNDILKAFRAREAATGGTVPSAAQQLFGKFGG